VTEKELFDIIDEGIDDFKKNEGYQKRMKVNTRAHSDWLIFNWRQLTWKENDLEYLIEIYPEFNEQEKIESWTLGAAVSYDLANKRYYLNHKAASKKNLEFIANNIVELLSSSFYQIGEIKKESIPFAVDLTP
jgi:hypothetical protein